MLRTTLFFLFGLALVQGTACTKTKKVIDVRSSCAVCHSPRPATGGEPHGIVDAHPGHELSCVDCHGGDSTSYSQDTAHVQPPEEGMQLRFLTAGELDELDPEYLRFVNPGDLRVAPQACGQSDCHGDIVDRVSRSVMTHTSGEVTVARYRAGVQDTPLAEVGAQGLTDPDYDPNVLGSSESITRFDPRVDETPIEERTYGQFQDDYMVKSCFRCHISDFGENRFPGDYRSSGCSACHMLYADNGVSESADPTISRDHIPRPITHEMTSEITSEQCMHCHYRGARIGPSYFGYREAGGAGFNPENPEVLGIGLHGHDPAFYLTDEDTTNFVDETPPDVHQLGGMTCIDCHTELEVHGDGHLYADTQLATEIRCESCHGSIDEETDGQTALGNPVSRLTRSESGTWTLGSADGQSTWEVTQIANSVDPNSPTYSSRADYAMGRTEDGFSHSDGISCETCHAGWLPSCYGCHVTMNYDGTGRVQSTGQVTPGRPSGDRWWVVTDDLVLMHKPDGMIGLSMPSERFFLTVLDGSDEPILDRVARPFEGEEGMGFGQRTVQPHTIQERAAFSQCPRCHILDDRSNEDQLRVTVGFGSDRFVVEDGAGVSYRLDAIQDEEGNPLVTVGHPGQEESRPLDIDLAHWLLNTSIEDEGAE